MKIVINKCYGGFGLSKQATKYLAMKGKMKGFPLEKYYNKPKAEALKEYKRYTKFMGLLLWKGKIYYCGRDDVKRNDPDLIKIVKKLGKKANGQHAELKIVRIPNGVEWEVEEYDGVEWIAEKHRTWR